MKYPIVLFIFLTSIFSSVIPGTRVYGCGNEYEEKEVVTKATGNRVSLYSDEARSYYFPSFDKDELSTRKTELESSLEKKYDYRQESDYALVLLKLGEKKKSLQILQRLVKKYPNEYNIVANLGTACELNGMDEQALLYISKAVALNPRSHEGSEWIHVNILKAKIEMKKYDGDYFSNHHIKGLYINPHKSYDSKKIAELEQIKDQLYWQLSERIAFVPAPDPVVADLLYSFANLVAVTDYLEASLPLYELSLKY